MRRRPGGSGTAAFFTRKNNRVKIKRFKWIIIPAAIAAAGILIYLYAFCYEPSRVVVTHRRIALRNWPRELNGFKVAVLADLHQRNTPAELARTRRIVELTNRENPDLVLLLGDFMGERFDRNKDNADPAVVAGLLQSLRSKYGVYAILGNHDHWIDGPAVREALEKTGVKVLENESAELSAGNAKIILLGLPDRMTRHDTLKLDNLPPPDGAPVIALSHSPDYFEELALPYPLMLSGHTHGGQVRLPWIGALLLPSQYGRKYSAQYHRTGDRQLFITHGLGTSIIRVRFFCPPEIAILTLEEETK